MVIEEQKVQHNIEIIKEKLRAPLSEGACEVLPSKAITSDRFSEGKKDKASYPQIIAVLKGNAYGMGLVPMANKLLDNQIDFFAVTDVEEGVELREEGFQNSILILNSTCIKEEVEKLVECDLIASVGSCEAVNMLNQVAKQKRKNGKMPYSNRHWFLPIWFLHRRRFFKKTTRSVFSKG